MLLPLGCRCSRMDDVIQSCTLGLGWSRTHGFGALMVLGIAVSVCKDDVKWSSTNTMMSKHSVWTRACVDPCAVYTDKPNTVCMFTQLAAQLNNYLGPTLEAEVHGAKDIVCSE